MSVVKVLEVMSNSTKSWEDAAQNAVTHASKTLHNIRSVWIEDQSAIVMNNKITEYRVSVKLSFEIDLSETSKTKKK
jgi:flavin-binding protein dodecin